MPSLCSAYSSVTLWELFSFGAQPFSGFSGLDAAQKIVHGDKLIPPASCGEGIASIITKCWETDPAKRPGLRITCIL